MSRRRKRGRLVNGVILLDKPIGMTSNSALQKVKRLFDANKAGHTGSLDPLATGMLPICLGEATKMAGYLLDSDKRYLATIKLGYVSTTGDCEGEITPKGLVPNLSEEYIQGVLERFLGESYQVPPMYSALKRNGEPLYKLAQQGIEVERQPRKIVIHAIKLHAFRADELDIEVSCSKGTYVRTLAEDLADAMGCGGYVTSLRRCAVGGYDDPSKMLTLAQLEALKDEEGCAGLDRNLLPLESALFKLPSVELTNDMAFFLMRGQAVHVNARPNQGWVRMYKGEGQFIGIGQVGDDGTLRPKRLVNL